MRDRGSGYAPHPAASCLLDSDEDRGGGATLGAGASPVADVARALARADASRRCRDRDELVTDVEVGCVEHTDAAAGPLVGCLAVARCEVASDPPTPRPRFSPRRGAPVE